MPNNKFKHPIAVLSQLSTKIQQHTLLPRDEEISKMLEALGFKFNYTSSLKEILGESIVSHIFVQAELPENWRFVVLDIQNSSYIPFKIFDDRNRLRVTGKCAPLIAKMELTPPYNLVVQKNMTNSVLAAHIYITGPTGAIVEDFGIKIISRLHERLTPYIEEARKHLSNYPTTFED